jgi:hypothetical protein
MEKKTKIYGFNGGGEFGYYIAIAMDSEGAVVASHLCSDESFMPFDLGMSQGVTRKHDIYDAKYGAGNWETEFIPSSQHDTHEGLKRAIELNTLLKSEDL